MASGAGAGGSPTLTSPKSAGAPSYSQCCSKSAQSWMTLPRLNWIALITKRPKSRLHPRPAPEMLSPG
jgi:hypothetical protein